MFSKCETFKSLSTSVLFLFGDNQILLLFVISFIICLYLMLLKLRSCILCIGLVSLFHMFRLLGKGFDMQGRSAISSAAFLDGCPSSANNSPATWI